jgi:hypothetical protein
VKRQVCGRRKTTVRKETAKNRGEKQTVRQETYTSYRVKRTGSKVTGKIRRAKTIAKKTGIGEADYKIKDA